MVDHFQKPFRSQTSKILNLNSENHTIVLTFDLSVMLGFKVQLLPRM